MYYVTKHFLNTEITPQNKITYKLKIENEAFIEEHLKRVAGLLENALKIFDLQKLIIMGFNDFRYSTIYVSPEEEVQTKRKTPIDVLVKQVPKNQIALIVKVQSKMRTFIWRAKAKLLR
jgi:hypothetical protein